MEAQEVIKGVGLVVSKVNRKGGRIANEPLKPLQ